MFGHIPRGGVKTFSNLGNIRWWYIDRAITVVRLDFVLIIVVDCCFVSIEYNILFPGKHGFSAVSKYWYSISNAFNCKFTL